MIGTPSHIALAMMSIGSVHIHAHFIGIFDAGQFGGFEPIADFNALDGIDRHHRLGHIGIKLVIDRIAKPDRHTGTDNFDHGADG